MQAICQGSASGFGSGDMITTSVYTDFTEGRCIGIIAGGGGGAFIVLVLLFVLLCVCLCVRRRRRRRREMDVESAKPASSDYKIQSAHTDITDDSYRADNTDESRLRSATSNPGFVSASLHVPSYDPLPSDDPPTGPHVIRGQYDIIKLETAEESLPATTEGRSDMGVALNPDNRTDLREVTGGKPREAQITRSDGAVTNITTSSSNPLQHEYVNTSLPSQQKKDSSLPRGKVVGKMKDLPAGEDGYDTIERETGMEGEDPQHKYDIVLLEQEGPQSKPVEHKYHLLENGKEGKKTYTSPKTHTLVVPSDGGKNSISDERGVVVEAGSSSDDTATNSKEPSKSGFHSSMSLKYTRSSSKDGSRVKPNTYTGPQKRRKVDPGYDEPWESRRPPPRRTTYSTESKSASMTSSSKESSNNLFDDPAYDTVGLSGSTKSAGKVNNPSSISKPTSSSSETSSVPQPSTHNKVQRFDYESTGGGFDSDLTGEKNKTQRFDHESAGGFNSDTTRGPGKRFDYETTGDFQLGDVSELEPSMMASGSSLNKSAPALPLRSGSGGSGKESATPFSGDQGSIVPPSSRNPYELTPKPATGGSRDIYESHILNLDSKPHPRDEQYEMKAATLPGHSRDMYEPTSLKPTNKPTPSSMFDDPMYDFGLNLSKP